MWFNGKIPFDQCCVSDDVLVNYVQVELTDLGYNYFILLTISVDQQTIYKADVHTVKKIDRKQYKYLDSKQSLKAVPKLNTYWGDGSPQSNISIGNQALGGLSNIQSQMQSQMMNQFTNFLLGGGQSY
jgi:hypothetical protein